jgi:hypothetical protein
MKIQLRVVAYGIFLLSLQCNTALSKLGKIPEFGIEPELYSSPLFRSQDISTTRHSTKITLIIEKTFSTENGDLFTHEFKKSEIGKTAITVDNIDQKQATSDLNFSSENQDRVATLAVFTNYKKCQIVGAMINEIFNSLEGFIATIFDQIADIVGSGEISYEESESILENVASNLLGLNSLDAEIGEIMYDKEPFSKPTTFNLNSFLKTGSGSSMMTIFNLYHLVLYELASQKATTSDSLDLANLTEIFINLETDFMLTIQTKLPEKEESTTIEKIRAVYFKALAAGREFLHNQRRELWSDTLTTGDNIATKVEKPLENLALLDFINEYNKSITNL